MLEYVQLHKDVNFELNSEIFCSLPVDVLRIVFDQRGSGFDEEDRAISLDALCCWVPGASVPYYLRYHFLQSNFLGEVIYAVRTTHSSLELLGVWLKHHYHP